jgi:hypothetical protein
MLRLGQMIEHVLKRQYQKQSFLFPRDFACKTLSIGTPSISKHGTDRNVAILCREPISINSVLD